jgi:hypothetical protein
MCPGGSDLLRRPCRKVGQVSFRVDRQYFPKGTDLSAHRASELNAVVLALNTRPRKTLGWRTPAEAFNELLRSAPQGNVATTS